MRKWCISAGYARRTSSPRLLQGTDSALGEPHATSYVKDPLNRAMLVVDGPVGIGKGVLFKRLGHMLTEGKMPIRLLYHHTGLAVPCVVVKLTASDHLWHRVTRNCQAEPSLSMKQSYGLRYPK